MSFGSTLALSIGLYGLLFFALKRSMKIATYQLGQIRIGLLIAGLWSIWLFGHGGPQLTVLILLLFLIFCVVWSVIVTAPQQSPIVLLTLRYGILMWLLFGGGGIFAVLQKARANRRTYLAKYSFVMVSGAIGSVIILFASQYMVFPIPTLSFQAVANSATVFVIMSAGVMEALWGPRITILLPAAFLITGVIMFAAIVSTQFTSIAALCADELV